MRSGNPTSTIDQVNESEEEKWMHIPIQPFTAQERRIILKEHLLRHGAYHLDKKWYSNIHYK